MRSPAARVTPAGEGEGQTQQKNEDSLRRRRKKIKRLVKKKATIRL